MKKILAAAILALSFVGSASACVSADRYASEINGKYYSYCYESGQPYTDYRQISWLQYEMWAQFTLPL